MMEQFNKKPEDLDEKQLDQAKRIASIFTNVRKFLYCLFSIGSMMTVVWMSYNIMGFIISTIILILGIIYSIFKLRDYLRGTI